MIRHFTTSSFAFLFLLIAAMAMPLNASAKDTKLEEIVRHGSVQDLKNWLSENDNKITSKHENIWENLSFRLSDFSTQHTRLKDPLLKKNDKVKIQKEIKLKVVNDLLIAELVLKAVDHKTLKLITQKNPPDEYPELSFYLYTFCNKSEKPATDGQRFVELFVNRAKGKIWFDDHGLVATGYYSYISVLDEISEECVSLVAESFVREEDWSILQDLHKKSALIKRVNKLYER